MDKLAAFYSSTLGKKVLMAVTGFILFGFVVVHMIGNLQLYLGAEALNHYAELLQKNRPVLWSFRAVLLFCVSVHIVAAAQVWWRSRSSRPVKYKVFRPPGVDYAARTMAWSGPIIAAFIVYHLLHLTVGSTHPDFISGDVYHNVVVSFQSPLVAVTYIIANVLLAIHLYHGLWSFFQTLGLDHPKLDPWRRRLAVTFAVIIGAGNTSMPLSVLAGVVQL
ncbi:MAG: succinate dehydrogenase cytochrome b subunit [bacterium]|nr:succinate dehydrogenase cytochrome b subunit [bacterium]